MSASAAAPVAAPSADTSTATGGNPMDELFDDGVPETNFDVSVVRQLGDGPSGVTPAKPVEKVEIVDGEVKGAKPAEATDDAPGNPDDDEVGEPYTIGKDGRVRGKDGKYMDKSVADAAAAKAAEATDTTKKEPTPFRYRTLGETHALDGATEDPDTGDITIKKAKAGVLREALNALHVRNVEHIPQMQAITKANEDLTAEVAALRQGGSVKEAQAEAILSKLDAALDEADDSKAVELFFKLRESRPTLKLEAEREYWKRQANEGKGKPATSPAKPAAAAAETTASAGPTASMAEDAIQSVLDVTESLAIEHEYRDISAEDWQQFNARAKRTPMAYVRPATAAHAKAHGVQIGESVFDNDLLREDIKDFVDGKREQRATAKRAADLAADRSRRTAPQVATPPAVEKGPPAGKAPVRGPFQSKEEVEDWWNSPTL